MGGIDLAKTYLGIELGSTRIKAVLIGEGFAPVASGGHDWENRFENGLWTYSLDDVWSGLAACVKSLNEDLLEKHGKKLETVGGIGVSAMMHGYLAFDKSMKQLAEFRTWRNTCTGEAAGLLTEEFGVNIPQRWSVAHLYQAMLNKESHVKDIAFLTTLAGYVHYKLTGRKAIGVGDASGVFPIDSAANAYDARMAAKFESLAKEKGHDIKLTELLPEILVAGEEAGTLTEEGARLLDLTGALKPGCPLCPPEGDAGTGMVATNAVKERTGNVSAGTSIFAMVVLEKGLSKLYAEIDMVTTPTGRPVAMVHCNNCTSDLDAWAKLFMETAALMGAKPSKPALYDALYEEALKADADVGGLLSYNYLSGEHTTGFEEGRPLFARLPDSRLTLANFMRALIFSAMASLKLGMDILTEKESVKLDKLLGHGGLFKTEGVGQRLMAAALDVPVAVMSSAGEGGAWGIALLAAHAASYGSMTLEAFLAEKVFAGAKGSSAEPEKALQESFAAYIARYSAGLPIERAAVENLK
jgi:sugar (pentulose or hexulose) kinase